MPYGILMTQSNRSTSSFRDTRPEPDTSPTEAALLIAVMWVAPVLLFAGVAFAMVCL